MGVELRIWGNMVYNGSRTKYGGNGVVYIRVYVTFFPCILWYLLNFSYFFSFFSQYLVKNVGNGRKKSTYNFFIRNSDIKAFLFLSALTSLGGYGVGFRHHYSSGNINFIFIIKSFAHIQGVPRIMTVGE